MEDHDNLALEVPAPEDLLRELVDDYDRALNTVDRSSESGRRELRMRSLVIKNHCEEFNLTLPIGIKLDW